jgi:alcohol dehydrogenase (NADP+)
MAEPAVVLRSGARMPALAWGTGTTWFCREPVDLEAAPNATLQANIVEALRAGLRHLDCAEMYQNEADCGAALATFLADSGVSREDVWVTSKARPGRAAPRPALLRARASGLLRARAAASAARSRERPRPNP